MSIIVLKMEFVTLDEDGNEVQASNLEYTSDPRPNVSLTIDGAYIDSSGDLEVDLSVTIEDAISEHADSPSDRLQSVTIEVNESELETIGNLPSLTAGTPAPPWRPYPFGLRGASGDTILYLWMTAAGPSGDARLPTGRRTDFAAADADAADLSTA